MKHDILMMDKAIRTSEETYCKRLQVGAVFSRDGRALIDGYNGTISGQPNECEKEITCEDCHGTGKKIFRNGEETMIGTCSKCNGVGFTVKTSPFTVHAEQNIVQYAAKKGIPLEGGEMFITHAPCPECSKLIVGAGIKRVVFKDFYRDDEGLNFLISCGVEVSQFNA